MIRKATDCPIHKIVDVATSNAVNKRVSCILWEASRCFRKLSASLVHDVGSVELDVFFLAILCELTNIDSRL